MQLDEPVSLRRSPLARLGLVGALAIVCWSVWFVIVVRVAVVIDEVPGGDAGLGTTPQLDLLRAAAGWTSLGAMILTALEVFLAVRYARALTRG